MDKFPSLSFVPDFPRLQRKILWTTKIALVSCSCRNDHNKRETGCRLREINLNGFRPMWKKPVKNQQWRCVHVDFLRLYKRDTAVDAVDLESRNKFRWDLLLLVLQTLIVSLCLDLDLVLVHPHYPSSSWKWIASCNNNLVQALKFYYPCIHDYTCCQEQLALDMLSTKTVELEEWYKAFAQQKSKLYTYIFSLLIL